ncbi:hypothetical protein [Absidia glauca]|uniref:Uncharacterized protein n=1 Tax=Absidia glauca TaxID=4829 RepID=A0A168RVV7_ABSGL|nr:hypothetical protein [Absidia glauca]
MAPFKLQTPPRWAGHWFFRLSEVGDTLKSEFQSPQPHCLVEIYLSLGSRCSFLILQQPNDRLDSLFGEKKRYDQTDSARKPPLFYEDDNGIYDGQYGSNSWKNDEGKNRQRSINHSTKATSLSSPTRQRPSNHRPSATDMIRA